MKLNMLHKLSEKEIQKYNQEIEKWWEDLDEQLKHDIYHFFICIKRDSHNSNFPKSCELDKSNHCTILFANFLYSKK